jgi:hypothetical protein
MVHAKGINMIHLLKFIVTFLSALFEEYGFLIIESKNSGNRFLGASILMVSSEVEIFLAIERDEMTIRVRSLYDKRKNNWYSIEIILALLGHKDCYGVLDDRNSSLIQNELSEIIHRFSKSKIAETLRLLDGIEKERSKRM